MDASRVAPRANEKKQLPPSACPHLPGKEKASPGPGTARFARPTGLGSLSMEVETLAKFQSAGVPVHLFKLKESELQVRAPLCSRLVSGNGVSLIPQSG